MPRSAAIATGMSFARRTVAGWVLALAASLSLAAPAGADCTPRTSAHVFFVTDRQPLGDAQLFSGERGLNKDRDAILTYGTLAPPARRETLRLCASEKAFLAALKTGFDAKRGRRALLYIHGYYTSFLRATDDALVLQRALHFPGPVIAYSWPSKVTSRLTYVNDEDNAGWSAVHFRALLATLLTAFPGIRLSFAAHSLGARFAADGLDFMRHGTCPKCVGRALFFAPDIDAETLRTGLTGAGRCSGRPPAAPGASAAVTVYVSNKDLALRQSQRLHGHQRAGQAGSEMLLCGGVDTIDVGYYKSSDKLGHGYHVDRRVTDDARAALAGASPASRGRKLQAASCGGGPYYELR